MKKLQRGDMVTVAYAHPIYGQVSEKLIVSAVDDEHVALRAAHGDREAVMTHQLFNTFHTVVHHQPGWRDLFGFKPVQA